MAGMDACMIPYKLDKPMDIIEIHEQGPHKNECYFSNPTVFEEGRRYLLFLRRDPDQPERYLGLLQGCALDVLVEGNNQYVLRYPVTGISLADSLQDLAVEMQFSDAYAIEDENSLGSTERNILLDAGWIVPFEEVKKETAPGVLGAPQVEATGRQWIYTHGIDLAIFRKMLGLIQDG